ncbi:MAG: sugar ABC transporter permease [Clostridiales bacterium]|nr:sugar ABC transporter permease [Clostridiales bacterium]
MKKKTEQTYKLKKANSQNQKTAYLFLAPSLTILTIFVFVPLIGAIGISLMNIDIYMNDISFAGLKNYLRMFQDSRVSNATFNTFYFAVLEVPLQILLALLLVMFMTKNTRFHKLLRTTFYLPYVCSMTAVSIMWSMLLNNNYGYVPYLLNRIGIRIPNLLSSTTWAMPTVILVTVWKNFGYTLTVLSAATLGVSQSLYEAAELDGATGIQKFLYVTIPGIKSTIGFCTVTTLITALQVFDQIYVMTSGGPQNSTETLVGYIYNRGFQTAPYDLGYASAIAVYLFLIIALLTFVMRKYAFNTGGDEE